MLGIPAWKHIPETGRPDACVMELAKSTLRLV
jgi:hypothetical protein